MFKRFIRKVFFRYYNINYADNHTGSQYNEYGMVKPQKQVVRYYATPAILSKKCIKKSIKKYHITVEDTGEEALEKAFKFYEMTIRK